MSQRNKSRSRLRELISVLRRRDIIHGLTPQKLRLILEDMGPTYVKIGQIMSMRSDVLPENYLNELQKLRADVRPVPFAQVKKLMEQEYGQSLERIFSEIDETPLGSASIAQVYRAVLRKSGERVVIKVQRPGIYEMMSEDIRLIQKALPLLKLVGGAADAVDLSAVIEEMWVVAQQEMNFLLEAEHNERFSMLNSDIRYVKCPKVYHSLTTARVMVMEQIIGIPIDQTTDLTQAGYDMTEIGLKLAESYCKQIFDDAFFHADPHPGNLWVSDGKIVFLDLGMMGSLNERNRLLFRKAIRSMAGSDIHELKEIVITLGEVEGKIDHTALYNDLDELVRKYVHLDLADIDLAKVIEELLELARVHSIRMPASITMLARGVLTMEGVLAACCPEVNMLQIITSHLSDHLFTDFNLSKELKRLAQDSYRTLERSREIPIAFADLLKMAIKGETKLNLEIVGSQEPLHKIDSMVNRLITCIIIAAVLMGSSIICTTQMHPQLFGIPALGALGFFVALLLGGKLVYDAVFSSKKRK